MVPKWSKEERRFLLDVMPGNERKESGSYYPPTSLVECLPDSALDPLLDEALATGDGRPLARYQGMLDGEYGLYFKVARHFATIIGQPVLMRELTRVGMRSRSLMEWVLRIMANLLREDELGLARVSSAPPPGRKTRAPGRKEFEQGRRLGTDLVQIREAIRVTGRLPREEPLAAALREGLLSQFRSWKRAG